jgi:hypothetical protein
MTEERVAALEKIEPKGGLCSMIARRITTARSLVSHDSRDATKI